MKDENRHVQIIQLIVLSIILTNDVGIRQFDFLRNTKVPVFGIKIFGNLLVTDSLIDSFVEDQIKRYLMTLNAYFFFL